MPDLLRGLRRGQAAEEKGNDGQGPDKIHPRKAAAQYRQGKSNYRANRRMRGQAREGLPQKRLARLHPMPW
jgi:hypothetical protein